MIPQLIRLILQVNCLTLISVSFFLSMVSSSHAEDDGDEIFRRITKTYGPLVVKEGNYKTESKIRPWSSWWYPLWEKNLFEDPEGVPSTLERYDQFVEKRTAENPRSAEFEKNFIYDSRAVGWAGRCDAWALASILEAEPTKPLQIEGIQFRIRDLKGLLIKMYEKADGLTHYGQRYNGQWDSLYEDIFPDEFHRFLMAELFEKKLPFIMDHDAGVEVWNSPVWKAQTRLVNDPQNPSLIHVKTWVFSADPHLTNLDFVGTGPVIHTYTYDLYGERRADGNLYVAKGKWVESSRWDHPDYLMPYPKQLKKESANKKLNSAVIDYIMKQGQPL